MIVIPSISLNLTVHIWIFWVPTFQSIQMDVYKNMAQIATV